MKKLKSFRSNYRQYQAAKGFVGDNVDEIDTDDLNAHPHITALATVLGSAAEHLSDLRNLGISLFNHGSNSDPVLELHDLSCNAGINILEMFRSDSSFDTELNKAQEAIRISTQNNINRREEDINAPFELKKFDFLIDEIALLIQICQRYVDFLNHSESAKIPSSNAETELVQQMQVLVGGYVQFEDAYSIQSVHKAVMIAEYIEVSDGVYLSSAVEDASFILQKSLERSISTCSEQAIMAIANRVSELLEPSAPSPCLYSGLTIPPRSKCRSEVEREGKKEQSGLEPLEFSAAFARALEEAVENTELADAAYEGNISPLQEYNRLIMGVHLTIRNELRTRDVTAMANSAQSAVHLVESIQTLIRRHLDDSSPLVIALLEQTNRVKTSYKDLCNVHCLELLEEDVFPSLSEILMRGAFGFGRYDISDAAFEASVSGLESSHYFRTIIEPKISTCLLAGTPRAQALIHVLENGPLGSTIRRSIDAEIFPYLVDTAVQKLCEAVLQHLISSTGENSKSRFSEWGALLFQREIRVVQQCLNRFLSERASTSQLSRLLQIVQVLQLDHPTDIVDIDASRSFSVDELKRILSLRTEFDPRAIEVAIKKYAAVNK